MAASNFNAEKSVLESLAIFGKSALLECNDIISSKDFYNPTYKVIFDCFVQAIDNYPKINYTTIANIANELGYKDFFKKENGEILRDIFDSNPIFENTRIEAKKVAKTSIARSLQNELLISQKELGAIVGDESVDTILGLAQKRVLEYSYKLGVNSEEAPFQIGQNVDDYIQYLQENENRAIGIPTGFSRFDNYIGGGLRRKTVSLIGARAKVGKALRHGEIVYTPYGPKPIENIKINDIVFDGDGIPTKVIGVYPQGLVDIYRVSFKDGYIDCCGEHQWLVNDNKKSIKLVKNTLELKNSLGTSIRPKYGIEISHQNNISFISNSTPPIHPYILGVLIVDGNITKVVRFTSNDIELVNRVSELISDDMLVKKDKSKYGYSIKNKKKKNSNYITNYIRSVGLNTTSHYKFIPNNYLINSYDVRLQVLKGLMDTDGSVSKTGNVEFSTTSEKLAIDVKFLAESLGYIVITKERYTSYDKIKKFKSFRLRIKGNDLSEIFHISRKKNRCHHRTKKPIQRKIINIEKIGRDYATCIMVESDNHTFLTNNFIKTHNSALADNVAVHVAEYKQIPVLMLDTEMNDEDHLNRLLAYCTKIPINDIERGKFASNPNLLNKIKKASERIKSMKYHYKNVSGKSFEEILSIMRRWIMKEVGFNAEGRTNDCLIIYDYLKLMSSESITQNIAEFQAMGFLITELHNFCVMYDCPVLSFVQLNRDGINIEDTSAISQSDRLVWLCTNFSIFKPKTQEEISEDGEEFGNRKLIPLVARHGPGIEDGNYINLIMQGQYAQITETKTKFEVAKIAKDSTDDTDEESDVPF